MSKLTRINQKIFGESGASTEFGKIGSESAGTPETTKDLAEIQSLSQYDGGLYDCTNDGNEPPRIEDLNALYLLLSSQIRYAFQAGIPEWHADAEYYVGVSFCQVAGVIYRSITGSEGSPNVNNDPTTSTANWEEREMTPAGVITEFAGVSTPPRWLACDGTSTLKATYPALWTAIHSEVRGTAGTGAVAFTDTGDVVTCAGHGFATGDRVYFSAITSTTGISINTNYYVIYVGVDTFKVASTLALALAGTALALTTNGTGSIVYAPWGITNANNFLLPDFREASPYGIGTRGALVTAHDAKILGEFGDDRMHNHLHPGSIFGGTPTAVASGTGIQGPSGAIGGPTASGGDGTPRTGMTTRGKIIGINYIIKT